MNTFRIVTGGLDELEPQVIGFWFKFDDCTEFVIEADDVFGVIVFWSMFA